MSGRRGSIGFDDFVAELENDPEFVAERKVIRPQTNLAIHTYRLRTAAGMSQSDLARAAGMTQPAISKVERGEANLRLQTVGRLAAALGVEAADLLVDPPAPARPVTRSGEAAAGPSLASRSGARV
ncbi:MAG TPA: helix-turn-helix transcriptional regulator [Longimicrobium sp.]|nr:helix-turn-helix transcriptional regulator [Longimicrobium sp.]